MPRVISVLLTSTCLKKRPKLITAGAVSDVTMCVQACTERDRGATLRLGRGGGTISASILEGHKTLFLTNFL